LRSGGDAHLYLVPKQQQEKIKRVAATAQIKSKLSVKPLIINLPCG